MEVLMCNEKPAWKRPPSTEPVVLDRAVERSFDDLDEWDALGPSPLWDDLWDAFELDDEMPDPQPEEGDFWGQPDDEEEEIA
jgi:hypothetical protein